MHCVRLACFAALLLTGAGCGPNGPFSVATCSFGLSATACSPILVPDGPRKSWELSFTVVNPNPGVPAGCAGTVDLSVNSPRSGPGVMVWEAMEQDPSAQCAQVGETMRGMEHLDGAHTVDVRFSKGQFTFRMVVRPESPSGP